MKKIITAVSIIILIGANISFATGIEELKENLELKQIETELIIQKSFKTETIIAEPKASETPLKLAQSDDIENRLSKGTDLKSKMKVLEELFYSGAPISQNSLADKLYKKGLSLIDYDFPADKIQSASFEFYKCTILSPNLGPLFPNQIKTFHYRITNLVHNNFKLNFTVETKTKKTSAESNIINVPGIENISGKLIYIRIILRQNGKYLVGKIKMTRPNKTPAISKGFFYLYEDLISL